MPIGVSQIASIVDGEIVLAPGPQVPPGDIIGFLTNLRANPAGGGPVFTIELVLSDAPAAHVIHMPLESFLSAAEYTRSFAEPVSLTSLESVGLSMDASKSEMERRLARVRDRLWLFRDDIYAPSRKPRQSEREEIILRVKALHYQSTDVVKRLKEQVANFDAIETLSKSRVRRQRIPDDVKLLVWTRDGGACMKCGGAKDLHFDHIIPHSRGGGDHAENIQLLCRACNLAKHNRLTEP